MKIDKYEILHPLGEGGFGSVMLAKDVRLDKEVAIKLMPYSEEAVKEVEIMKDIHYAGLPQIYDVISQEGSIYLVMEYVEGVSLKDYLTMNKKVPYEKAVEWITELGEIMCFLHGLHPCVIYRDLKPSNIMIAKSGHLKLIDFGAAFVDSHLSKDNYKAYGTKGYSAPELWKRIVPNQTCDVYSLGVVLHEMLTGERKSANTMRRPIREYDASLPKYLEKIVARCLMNEPQDRYRNVREFLDDLKLCQKSRVREEIGFGIKKVIVILGYIAALFATFEPLFGKEISEYSVSDFQTALIMTGTAMLLHMILIYLRSDSKGYRISKQIWFTTKDYIGLFGCAFVMLGVGTMLISKNIEGFSMSAHGDSAQNMWVEFKDGDSRSVLLSDNSVYEVDDALRIEIPSSELEETNMKIQVVAYDNEGKRYESQKFNISKP